MKPTPPRPRRPLVPLLIALLTPARIAAGAEPALGPFEIRSPGGDHAVQIGLAAQLRASFSDSQPGAAAARQQDLTLEVRRLRPMLRASLLKSRVEAFLHLNAAPGAVELLDLFAQFNFHPQARLRVGQFKIPYTRYRMQYFTQLQLTDWSITSRYLGAERQLGAALHNGYERGGGFEYAAGVFSGVNARRSHGIGVGLLYGEPLPNPSDLSAPSLPTELHAELALRVGYSSPTLHPETPSDAERGGPRFGASFSAAYDLQPDRYRDFALRLAAEAQLKLRGVSLAAVGYYSLFQGDGGAADLRPAFYGAMARLGLRLREPWGIALRYGLVLSSEELRGDARARAAQRLAAATPGEAAALKKQYAAAGALEQDQELLLCGSYYGVGHGLKVQLEAGWLRQVVSGAALDGARARLQLQLAF